MSDSLSVIVEGAIPPFAEQWRPARQANPVEPPFKLPADLRDLPCAPSPLWNHLQATLGLSGDDSVFRAGFTLVLLSWHQVPCGSVADDDHELASLTCLSLEKWRRIKKPALVEFRLCSDGRWHCPLIVEQARRVLHKRWVLDHKFVARLGLENRQWEILRHQVFCRDDYTCRYCGTRGGQLECDHIIPVSRGGASDEDNLATACRSCNLAKGSKLIAEWRPSLLS